MPRAIVHHGHVTPPSHAGESHTNAPASFDGSAHGSGRPPCVHVYVHGGFRVSRRDIPTRRRRTPKRSCCPRPFRFAHVPHNGAACERARHVARVRRVDLARRSDGVCCAGGRVRSACRQKEKRESSHSPMFAQPRHSLLGEEHRADFGNELLVGRIHVDDPSRRGEDLEHLAFELALVVFVDARELAP